MYVIIPMTGYGSRFVAAGYKELKPFIPVMGVPIIEWIVKKMYPADTDFIFVCRGEHLKEDASMEKRLVELAPRAKIVSIKDWVKKGPVYDVLRAYRELKDSHQIDVEKPCIINYCDFYMTWDFQAFARMAKERDCDGSVPCYTGFHPNLLPQKNYYASCLTDDEDNLLEIREKYSFEKDKTMAKHSPGVYYFKNGYLMEKYCQILTEHEECAINGEYYASLPYNFMVQDGLKVWVPTNVKYFCQWGTPEDMQEFVYWTDLIRQAAGNRQAQNQTVEESKTWGKVLIPMAGAGQRFAEAGYQVHKPAIMTIDRFDGHQKPMVVCATKDLPGVRKDGSNVIYVDRTFHREDGVEDAIRQYYEKAQFITIDHLTQGQACTCMLAENYLNPKEPLLIAGCDNGMDIDVAAFQELTRDCDCIVFTYRHNEAVLSNPNAYGWMITDQEGNITGTSIKKAISDTPMEDPAVVATFWFREAGIFLEATEKMIRRTRSASSTCP